MSATLELLLLVSAWPAPASAPTQHTPAPIEAQVYAELVADLDQRAYVVLLLTPIPESPEAPTLRGPRLERRMQAVAAVQERVLARRSGDFELRYRYRTIPALTGRVDATELARLAADPDVVSIGADARGSSGSVLDDSVGFIRADDVHALGLTGAGITVAVLDTGIDTDHTDLGDDVAPGARHFLDQGGNVGPGAEDDHGHGTNVAGIVTSRGTVAPLGVAPDADILAVKVLDSNNFGWLTDWIAGVDYVTSVSGSYANLCAINMSLVSTQLYGACPCDNSGSINQAFQAAVLAARNAGIVSFVSSGNQGSCTQMASPACLSAAVAVAAVYDQDLGQQSYGSSFGNCSDATSAADKVTCFSNRNGCNQLAAPGCLIRSTGRGGGLSQFTGTSQAAPHCAGVAALMCTADGMTPARIVELMQATGTATVDPCSTAPNPIRIDALGAVQAAFERTFCDALDGSLAACPCANPGDPETGCDIQQATGGVHLALIAQETAPANRATVLGTGYPIESTPATVVIRSPGLDPAAPVVFGDGLRCVGVPLVRLAATVTFFGFAEHTFGHGAAAGAGEFHYQLWFRNTPAMFCTPDGFNLSNGRVLDW